MTTTPSRKAVALGTAHDALAEALAAAQRAGHVIPCQNPARSLWWLSEDADERAEAARLCTPCPVLVVCRKTATAARESWGVWGGRDVAPPRATPPPKPKPGPCAVEGCPNPGRSAGYCNSHYARWRRYGDPTGQGVGRWPKQ